MVEGGFEGVRVEDVHLVRLDRDNEDAEIWETLKFWGEQMRYT